MLIPVVPVVIVYGSYLALRLYERHKKAKKPSSLKRRAALLALAAPAPSGNPVEAEFGPDDPGEPTIAESRKNRDRTLITAGIFALSRLFPPLQIVGLASYAYTVIPHLRRIEQSVLRDRRINVDALFFVAETLTLGLGQFVAASVTLWLNYSALVIMGRVRGNSRRIVEDIFGQLPPKAWVLVNEIEVEIPLRELKLNDILIVHAGEIIAADGIITEGVATIDQRALTGESRPAEKGVGDAVLAGSMVLTGRVRVKIEKSGEDTASARIMRVLTQSTDFKSTLQLKGEEWANKATAPMFFLSLPVLLTMGGSAAAVFIYSHIGYRIRFLAQLATFSCLVNAAKAGILVSDVQRFENICKIDTVLFDLSGVTPTGMLEVVPQLRRTGVKHIAILSGDHREEAKSLANRLGMDACYFSVPPESKAAIVQELQQAGRTVCFVGDGISDAVAMKQANASVSLRGAATLAVDMADVLLLDGNLANLPRALKLSQELDAELRRRLTLTLIPAGLNLGSLFFLHYGIIAALAVKTVFFLVAVRNPTALFKELPGETVVAANEARSAPPSRQSTARILAESVAAFG